MKINHVLVLLISALLLAIAATTAFFTWYYVVDVQEVDIELIVADYVGIDASTGYLGFGGVPPGGSGTRWIVIKNIYNTPVKVSIRAEGEVAPFVSMDYYKFSLQPGQNKTVIAAATVPDEFELGTYAGILQVWFTRDF